MIYPNCPKCGNGHQTLFIDDAIVEHTALKAVCCPQCGPLFFYKDYDNAIQELTNRVSDVESNVEDLL